MEDLALQKMKNIILDETLKNINERERERQNLEIRQRQFEYKKKENMLIMRNKIIREKRREIENLYEINSELKFNIHQEENAHELQLKEMKNEYDNKIYELQNTHKKNMQNLDLQNLENKKDFQKKMDEIDLG